MPSSVATIRRVLAHVNSMWTEQPSSISDPPRGMDTMAVPWLLSALQEKRHTALLPIVQWPQATQKGLGLDPPKSRAWGEDLS